MFGVGLRLTALVAVVALGAGCATFEVEGLRADGTVAWRVRESGAPLLTRNGSFEITDQWLDEATNTLHENVIRRNSDENAQPQVEALKILAQTIAAQSGQMVAPGLSQVK